MQLRACVDMCPTAAVPTPQRAEPTSCCLLLLLPLLQALIDSRYRNVYGGRATTDEEIAGLLIAILFAGQHTSSVTSSWTGYRMIATPKWFQVSGAGAGNGVR